MYIKIENSWNYSDRNSSYNYAITPIVEQLCQSQELDPSGYILTSEYDLQKKWKNDNQLKPSIESKLTDYIVHSSFNNIIVNGAMGSGKSTTTNFVLDKIKESYQNLDYKREPIIIRINFNAFLPSNENETISLFSNILFNNIQKALIGLFQNDRKIFLDFLNKLKSNTVLSAEFINFNLHYVEGDIDWESYTTRQKISNLFKWIDTYEIDSIKLNILGQIIRFLIKEKHFQSNEIIIFFDNIDSFDGPLQNKILHSVFAFNQTSGIKSIIALRLTAMGWLTGSASYSFVEIRMIPPPIETVIEKRLSYILESNYYDMLKRSIDSHFLDIFNQHIKHVSHVFKSSKDASVVETLSLLSSDSIRRGLYLFERIFINNIYSFESIPKYYDLDSAIFMGLKNEYGLFDDPLITNVFRSSLTGSESLIAIRILQILNHFSQFNKSFTIQNLFDSLSSFNITDEEEILSTINNLTSVRKSLIVIESFTQFYNYSDLIHAKDSKVIITLLGKNYINHLIHNFDYFRYCLLGINWVSEDIPEYFEDNRLETRFSIILNALNVLFEIDLAQRISYDKLKTSRDYFSLVIPSIIINFSIFILKLNQKQQYLKETIKDWYSILLNIYNVQKDNGIIIERKLDNAISMYKNVINNIE